MGHGTGNECANRLWRTTTDQEPQPRDNFHGDNVLESSSKWSGMQADAAHSHDSKSRTVRALPGATPGGASSSAAESSTAPEVRTEDATPTTGAPKLTSGSLTSVVPRVETRVITQAFPPHTLSSH